MNFFGHAVVATWRSREPGFVLGSMLPDFATMIGTRVPEVRHDWLDRGVAFHHETDRVFHDTQTFRRLQLEARQTLRELGLPRASALAVGHIGVEILLDAALTADPHGVAGYLEALSEGHPGALGGHIAWSDPDAPARYETLRVTLSDRGVSSGPADPRIVAWRVARALSSRPRLRLSAAGELIVHEWAEASRTRIASAARGLVAEIARDIEGGITPPPSLAFE